MTATSNRRPVAGVVFAVTLLAYIAAVTQRSSLGVAGVEATARFHASATALSMLAVAQVVIYAAMQVPVGMVLDRLGPARLVLIGAVLMAAGQFVVALSPTLPVAVVGRMLVGIGDATTFVSGLRVLNEWFPPRRVPIMQQWFVNLGQLGQLLSVVPFAFILHLAGWQSAFLAAAGLSVIVTVAVALFLHDTRSRRFAGQEVSLRDALRKLNGAVRRPGTRLGFWSHFVTQFAGTVVALLWGYPMLVQGLGVAPTIAALLIVVPVAFGMLCGPFIGILTAQYPLRRSNIVIALALALAIGWIGIIVWPGQPPLWFVIVVFCLTGAAGTGSTIGFDFARTFNPSTSYGSASGVVNMGGFSATAISIFTIGVLVDLSGRNGDGSIPWSSFQVALWTIPGVDTLGLISLWLTRSSARSKLAAEEGVVVAPLWQAIVRRWRRG